MFVYLFFVEDFAFVPFLVFFVVTECLMHCR